MLLHLRCFGRPTLLLSIPAAAARCFQLFNRTALAGVSFFRLANRHHLALLALNIAVVHQNRACGCDVEGGVSDGRQCDVEGLQRHREAQKGTVRHREAKRQRDRDADRETAGRDRQR